MFGFDYNNGIRRNKKEVTGKTPFQEKVNNLRSLHFFFSQSSISKVTKQKTPCHPPQSNTTQISASSLLFFLVPALPITFPFFSFPIFSLNLKNSLYDHKPEHDKSFDQSTSFHSCKKISDTPNPSFQC